SRVSRSTGAGSRSTVAPAAMPSSSRARSGAGIAAHAGVSSNAGVSTKELAGVGGDTSGRRKGLQPTLAPLLQGVEARRHFLEGDPATGPEFLREQRHPQLFQVPAQGLPFRLAQEAGRGSVRKRVGE